MHVELKYSIGTVVVFGVLICEVRAVFRTEARSAGCTLKKQKSVNLLMLRRWNKDKERLRDAGELCMGSYSCTDGNWPRYGSAMLRRSQAEEVQLREGDPCEDRE